MPEIGFLTAFLGGVLALLSPCSALLLPAFFASSVGRRAGLLLHGVVFYAGLLLTLLPFGLGVGALGTFFVRERGVIIALTSLLLVVFGVMQLFGAGFDLARLIPGLSRLQRVASRTSGYLKTLLLGAAGGVAGFCAGPILGAILGIGFARGQAVTGALLLATYALGMVVPLLIIAAVWENLSVRGRQRLRGTTVTLGRYTFHTTQLVTGALLILVGVVFWLTNGLVSAPSLVPTSVLSWLQVRGEMLSNPVAEIVAVVLLACFALWLWWHHQRRNHTE